MISFTIDHKSSASSARSGILETPHGIIETPALIPVATQAAVKTLTTTQVHSTGTQALIANTYHLHTRHGENAIAHAGGIHSFMNWDRPIMTDSGGFQVFSLGFGKDYNVGKLIKIFPGETLTEIESETQPKGIRILEEGALFRSPVDGQELFLGPKESIKIQHKIGADMIFAFDECTPPLASHAYAKSALARTHRWASTCLEAHTSDQALFGIVQGSRFRDLREKSATFISSLPFSGFGIGGDLGHSKHDMDEILEWTVPLLDNARPRHLLGIGMPEDMEPIIKHGIDTFDCTVPTHCARHGTAFTSRGRLNLRKRIFLEDNAPLDDICECEACVSYSRAYIAHLVRAHEITGLVLLTIHNLTHFNRIISDIRKRIRENAI